MMTMSDRSEFVGANVEPEIKATLNAHIRQLKLKDKNASISRFVNEAIREKFDRDSITIVMPPVNTGENLPFDE